MKNELKKAIDNYDVANHNKKLLIDQLGADNLKNYPFQTVKVQLAQSQSQGTEILEVNVKTFRNKHYCSVAEMPEMRLTPELVERVGNQMLDDLAAK